MIRTLIAASSLLFVASCSSSSASPDGGTSDDQTDAGADGDVDGNAAPTPPFGPSATPLMIGCWCGPPDDQITVARFQEMAAAGFTHEMPWCWGRADAQFNQNLLTAAQQAGIQVFVHDARIPIGVGNPSGAMTLSSMQEQGLDGLVSDYASYPALAGYVVTDEPEQSIFDYVAQIVDRLHSKDPAHIDYVNLLPNYAFQQASDYQAYVSQYMSTVKPNFVTYDFYPFLVNGDASGFFANLATIGAAAQKANAPWGKFTQSASGNGGMRLTGEAEKRWDAMQTLAYGAKAILWFTYWTPPSGWDPSLIDLSGNETPQYDQVKRINADLRALGKYLVGATSDAVFMNGNVPSDGTKATPGLPVVFTGPGDVTVGLFHDANGHYALFANRNYHATTSAQVSVTTGGAPLWQFDKGSSTWSLVAGSISAQDGGSAMHLSLQAGDAELYGWM